ncbi:hypothetical protein FHY55_05915 [Oceanicola sp. D3]|uniref:hypothetical protein n=1 Tax=Oceanicola sp. D3 TaxID=2587163 RepID=UPI0011238A64|nr:hypothetical protein [Oceanicola sp. D3]QDC08801.1 hypothetical protein FHY55_05915 [Oceanicola sp. D3]
MLWLLACAVVAWLAGAAGWLWFCAGLRHQGARGRAGRIAVQLSGFALLAGTMAGSPLIALAGAAFPPSALFLMGRILRAPALAAELAPWALGGFLLAGLGGLLFLKWRGARPVWALGVALLAGTLAMVVAGELTSRRAMCAEAAKHGATAFMRNSFSWSLRHPRREYNFEVHALSQQDDVTRVWSYQHMRWDVIPPTVSQNIDAPPHRMVCPRQP